MTMSVLSRHCAPWAFAAAAVGLALAGVPAAAQPPEEIVVTAPPVQHEQVGRSHATGAPIERISVTHYVNYGDLDLTKQADAAELETRIKAAAEAACKQLDTLYPLIPPDRACVSDATEGGMMQAKQAIADAGR